MFMKMSPTPSKMDSRRGKIIWSLVLAVVAAGVFFSVRGLVIRQRIQAEQAAEAIRNPSVQYRIGDEVIAFPVPQGYVDLRSIPEAAEIVMQLEAFSSMSAKRLITEFVPQPGEAADRSLRNRERLTIAIPQGTESLPPLLDSQWRALKSEIKVRIERLMVEAARYGHTLAATAAPPGIPSGMNPIPLETAFEDEETYAFFLFSSDGDDKEGVRLYIQVVCRVKGKCLTFTCSAPGRDEATQEALRKTARGYRKMLKLLN